MSDLTAIERGLMSRPRYWRLWRVTEWGDIRPAWLHELLRQLLLDGNPVEVCVALVINALVTHRHSLALVSSRDLNALAGPHIGGANLRLKKVGGKSLYQAVLYALTEGYGILRLVNNPSGKEPGVYEVVEPKILALLPPVTGEIRELACKAAGLAKG